MKRSGSFAKAIQSKQQATFERRLFSYTDFIPERRSGIDRRDAFERRHFSYSGFIPERRSGTDRRNVVSFCRPGDASVARFCQKSRLSRGEYRL
jgi:hypothetical protein